MPLATVTGGPTAPAGRNIAAGTRLAVRYDEPYADGANVYPQTHNAEWDVSTNSWKPLGAANGTTFQIPVGADGYPRPPGSWLTELLVLDDGSEQTSRRGPIRIYETTAGEWFYGSPAPGAIFVSNPDVPGATAVLQTEVGVANGVAALDGAGGATFTGLVNMPTAAVGTDDSTPFSVLRSAGTNVNMEFALGAVTRYLGLDENGNLMFGDAADLNTEGSPIVTTDGATFIGQVNVDGADIEIDARAIAEYGGVSGSNEWVRFYNGVQIAWGFQTAGKVTDAELKTTWTFNAAFNGKPRVVAMPANTGSGITDSEREQLFFFTDNTSGTSVDIRGRVDTATFSSGDNHGLYVMAIGKWY